MVTLNTRRPPAHNYRLFGTEGSLEWYDHEGFCRYFGREREETEGWQQIPVGTAAADDDVTVGHGGTDIKTVYYFTKAILEDSPIRIDVYRMGDFTLPGIIAAQSAEYSFDSAPTVFRDTAMGASRSAREGALRKRPR